MQFSHLQSIYRNYDIRGKFPEEITTGEVYKIGKALVDLYNARTVVVGYDNRPANSELFNALVRGITEQGADVIDVGMVTTPMLYLASGTTDTEVAVMITASHMPSEYSGLKICIDDALPIGIDSGLSEIRDYVKKAEFKKNNRAGVVTTLEIKELWRNKLKELAELTPHKTSSTVVLDPANAVGVLEIDTLRHFGDALTIHTIFDTLDHTYPNHEANPLKIETLESLKKEVVRLGADMGIALDGDADRIGIIDEKGESVPQDIVGVLIAEELMRRHGVSTIIYDIRSSKRVGEVVASLGGTALPSRIGHTYIRRAMRDQNALFALELSGHLFFRDLFYSEAGVLPALILLSIMRREGKTLSELAHEHRVYHHSGEINSTVTSHPDDIYERIRVAYPDATHDYTDGLTLVCDDWWCNIRPSANDPVMRLNLEADTPATMKTRTEELLALIRSL